MKKEVKQQPSTQAILDRDPSLDALYQMRPLPNNWVAVPNAKTIDEAVSRRKITKKEARIIRNLRHSERNTKGQYEHMGVSGIKRVKAIDAFMAIAGTPLKDLFRKIMELSGLGDKEKVEVKRGE
jgi:hypothetical protein